MAAQDPLTVVPFCDPLVEQMGHRVDSFYVEAYWLPVVGPASVLPPGVWALGSKRRRTGRSSSSSRSSGEGWV